MRNQSKKWRNLLIRSSVSLNSVTSEKALTKTNPKSTIINWETQKSYYWNQCFDKGRLKNFVLWFFRNNGEHKTVQLVEEFKNLGFQYATKAGISLGIEDLKVPPKKASLIFDAEKETSSTIKQYKRGDITGVERFQRLIDTWHRTSEQLKQEVIDNFEATDILNPVYMMAFSGARGNISQVRQLVGMRGLMSNPQGQIIDFPIRSNFREGLTLTEYIISSYGARKGIVDTALRTANAGYLTRRLVDVAQHVIISNFDCGTKRGIFLKDMKEGNKTIVSLNTRLIGRVSCTDIYSTNESEKNLRKIAKRNQEISIDLAFEISKVTKKVFVRSALTCETKKLVCQLCYGWSLAQGNLVSIGEAIGVIAAQSIGEPGTQLTMRTFHTGGVFSGDVTDQIRMPFSGMIIYNAPIAGTLIRTPEGKIAFLTKTEGSFTVCKISYRDQEKNIFKKLSEIDNTGFTSSKLTSILPKGIPTKKYKIPEYTLLYAKNGDFFNEKEVVAQISSISKQKNATDEAELTLKAELDGQLHINYLEVKENKAGPKLTKKEKENEETLEKFEKSSFAQLGFGTNQSNESFGRKKLLTQKNGPTNLLDSFFEAWTWGNAWILSGKIYHSPIASTFFPQVGDFMNKNSLMNGPSPLKYLSIVSGEAKLEYFSRFFPKYLQMKILQNSGMPYKLSSKNKDQNRLNFLQSNSNLKHKIYPTLNTEFLTLSVRNVTYKNIGYYLKLNESLSYRKENSVSKMKSSSTKQIQIEKYPLQNNSLTSTDSIFVIPENNQVLLNNSLLKLYPSNWQPEFKTIVQWFPAQFKTHSSGIIAKEEISMSLSFTLNEKRKVLSQNAKIKTQSLFALHKSNLRSNLPIQLHKKNKLQYSQSIGIKMLCLSKTSYLENLKLNSIQIKTNMLQENQETKTNVQKVFSNLNTDLQNISSLTQKAQTFHEAQFNNSRFFWIPMVTKNNLVNPKVTNQTNKLTKLLTQSSTKENCIELIKNMLKTKLQNKKNSSKISFPLKKMELQEILNKSKVKNLKSFCFIYSKSLKNSEKQTFLLQKLSEKRLNKNNKQKNVWVYFVPKKAVSKKVLQFSSTKKYLLYPGQKSHFDISFDKNLMVVFQNSEMTKTLQNEKNNQLISIKTKNQNFKVDKWLENKTCRYSLSTKNLLSFSNQTNQLLHNLKPHLNGQLGIEESSLFFFQKVDEFNINLFKDMNNIEVKNDIYELSKTSDNPLNGLNKINADSVIKRNLTSLSNEKISKRQRKLNFMDAKISGSFKLFKNKNQTLNFFNNGKLDTKNVIKKLNYLFLISPDFNSQLSEKKNRYFLTSNFISERILTKQKPKLHFVNLFNKSFLSLTQLQFFKNPFINKQQSSLQIITKYANIDIKIKTDFSQSFKIRNNGSVGQNNLVKQNLNLNLTEPSQQNGKANLPSHLTSIIVEPGVYFCTFYITIPTEQQNLQNLALNNHISQNLVDKNSFSKVFDYPFKDYKISFTKKTIDFPSKFTKNYLTNILFKESFHQNNTHVGLKNKEIQMRNSTLFLNNLNFHSALKLNKELKSLVQVASYRSMMGYSLEPIFNPLMSKRNLILNSNLNFENQNANVLKTWNLKPFKNNLLSVIKFYGTENDNVSSLVPFAKSYSYSPFEGEILKITSPYSFLKKEKNSLKTNLYFENKSISLQQKQHVSIFLTKNDLVSYYFMKSKNSTIPKISNKESSTNFQNSLQDSSKNYLIKDLILPISSDISLNLDKKQNSSEIENNSFKDSNMVQLQNLYQIPEIIGGFPHSKTKQRQSSRKQKPFLTLKGKTMSNIGSRLKNSLIQLNKGDQNNLSSLSLNNLTRSKANSYQIGDFIVFGDQINLPSMNNEQNSKKTYGVSISGQIIHINKTKLTIRKGQPLFISPKSILHKLDGDFIESKSPVITLAYQRLKTGDIVQGIPKIEQFFEARTTKRGRLFRDSLPNLLKALFKRYLEKMPLEKAVRQSFYKIQQIIVDGVLRVYRSQGVTIADKHLEIIVKQMTSKVRILEGGQTGFFPGEVVDLDFVEQVNQLLMKKIQYEPLVLGITKSSLEVESFLSAASFQQTTRVLSHAAIDRKKDFLKGLKENVILGNLIPAGTGYLVYLDEKTSI